MLFLLGFSCFAETVSLFADDGTTFVYEISMRAPASNEEMEGAAVYVVGKNGEIISTGRLRTEKQVQQASQASVDFMEKKIPTYRWNGRSVEVKQVEIFGKNNCSSCEKAKMLASKIFGDKSVKSYNVDDIKNGNRYSKKLNAILAVVGFSNFNKWPGISVIDSSNKRWFVGGAGDFNSFVKANKTETIILQAATSQTVIAAQADSTDFSNKNIQTKKWNGEKVEPVQIEIFGTKECPYCVQAKALADRIFPERTKEYNYHASDYAQRSEKIMNKAGIYNYGYIPRVSVIAVIDDKPVRFVLGGFSEFSGFVNRMSQNQTAKFN